MTNHEQAFKYYARKAPRQWFHVANAIGDDTAKVFLYDAIGGLSGVSASEFVQSLNEIEADTIEVHINCPGGSVYDGIAIMNALRQHPARVVSFVDGLAASAASYIAVGGAEEVVMAENAELMIHDAWGACMGDAAEMQRMADDLERISNNIASVYARRASGEVSQWRDAMLEETWYSADEAVAAGLADRVDRDEADEDDEDLAGASASAGNRSSKARWNLDYYEHAGRDHAPDPFIPAAHAAANALPVASAPGSDLQRLASSGDTTQEGAARMDFDELLNHLRQAVGVTDADADAPTVLAALNEAMAEQGDTTDRPEGTVVIDEATLTQLVSDAAAGREALNAQQSDRRSALVRDAVRDGRISNQRTQHWVDALTRDPGAEQDLAGLAKGLIPLEETGHASSGPHQADDVDSATYNKLYGNPAAGTKED